MSIYIAIGIQKSTKRPIFSTFFFVEKQFLEKAEKIIDKNLTNSQFGVPDLGKGIGLSRMQLYRKLKSIRGLNANEFIREYRIKKAAQLMGTTELNVSEILFEVGFSNRSYFTKCFKKILGVHKKLRFE